MAKDYPWWTGEERALQSHSSRNIKDQAISLVFYRDRTSLCWIGLLKVSLCASSLWDQSRWRLKAQLCSKGIVISKHWSPFGYCQQRSSCAGLTSKCFMVRRAPQIRSQGCLLQEITSGKKSGLSSAAQLWIYSLNWGFHSSFPWKSIPYSEASPYKLYHAFKKDVDNLGSGLGKQQER